MRIHHVDCRYQYAYTSYVLHCIISNIVYYTLVVLPLQLDNEELSLHPTNNTNRYYKKEFKSWDPRLVLCSVENQP